MQKIHGRKTKSSKMKDETRPIPRPFTMHWGKGQIVEEASYFGRYHEPSIQLMKYEDGSESIRFCYYTAGRFQRSPLMIGKEEMKKMKAALNKTPRLKKLLKAIL